MPSEVLDGESEPEVSQTGWPLEEHVPHPHSAARQQAQDEDSGSAE